MEFDIVISSAVVRVTNHGGGEMYYLNARIISRPYGTLIHSFYSTTDILSLTGRGIANEILWGSQIRLLSDVARVANLYEIPLNFKVALPGLPILKPGR